MNGDERQLRTRGLLHDEEVGTMRRIQLTMADKVLDVLNRRHGGRIEAPLISDYRCFSRRGFQCCNTYTDAWKVCSKKVYFGSRLLVFAVPFL